MTLFTSRKCFAVLASCIAILGALRLADANPVHMHSRATGLQDMFRVVDTHPSQLPSAASSTLSNDLFGYLLIYYRDDTEQVHAGLSVGNDALSYTLYNNGTLPILSSKVGSTHVRDPYLVRSHDKTKNWIIASDNSLAAFHGDYDRAQRSASRHITIWESEGASLTRWKPARLSPELTGAWSGGVQSPEAYWDQSTGTYIVVFGSNRFADEDTQHTGSLPLSEIYYVRTSDFVTFTAPKIYYEIVGGGLSDMTIASTGKQGEFVRFFRDDTNKAFSVRAQKSSNGMFGKWIDIVGQSGQNRYVSDTAGANGGPLLFRDNVDKDRWHVWIDRFTGAYLPFETSNITDYGYTLSKAPSFPADLKQGSVTPLTSKEYEELKAATF